VTDHDTGFDHNRIVAASGFVGSLAALRPAEEG
jgi:hypothetical protein